jgi:hypothetical protein
MSELEDLIAVYGAVDTAVQEEAEPNGELRARVTALLPLYESPRVHWYRDFVADARRRGVEPPPLDEALARLSKPPATPRLAARRLLGLWAGVQAVPELKPDGELGRHVANALGGVVAQEGLGEEDDTVRRLHELMAADIPHGDIQSPDQAWEFLMVAIGGSVDVPGLGPRPCSGSLVQVDGPLYSGPAAALETEFVVDDLAFDKAIRFLSPEKWPDCCDFWCDMVPVQQGVPNGVHRFREYVSTDCTNQAGALFSAHAVLDFTFISLPGAAITNYDLAPGQPQPDMLVDCGSLVVRQMENGIHVKTTKRLAMNRAYSGQALSMVACVLGYGDSGKDLMFNCARVADDTAGIDFPGSSKGAAGPKKGDLQGQMVANIAEQTAATLKECIEQQVAYTKEWAGRVDRDDYTADDLARDMMRFGTRLILDSAKAVDLGIRNVQAAAMAPPGESQEPQAEQPDPQAGRQAAAAGPAVAAEPAPAPGEAEKP